ncbi:hypothetical protein [Burkholderia sp. USMB20]|uniref:hypothetical protein n=1 Tax=Burkholderia sp. USMB20 TaxID=1571773 RepID=UPI0005CF16A5|nr:hypothetical protein [Burkholderia sp. USMB20]TGN96111.1 hypothetical protein PL79_018880 [Burkholderia sp. USMB20]
MKPVRLLVQVPHDRVPGRMGHGPVDVQIETTAHGIKRAVHNGEWQTDYVLAFAYIPTNLRDWFAKKGTLKFDEYAWTECRVKDNPRALAAFMESGEYVLVDPRMAEAAREYDRRTRVTAHREWSMLVGEYAALADHRATFGADQVREIVDRALTLAKAGSAAR